MIALLDPRVWLAVLALMLTSYGVGRLQQHSSDSQAQTAALLKSTQAARQKEADWQIDVQALEEVHANELRTVAADRDRALAGLRSRPARLPEAARSACAGSTGAELSGVDAEAFTRLAARADAVRSDLAACRAWVETVTR